MFHISLFFFCCSTIFLVANADNSPDYKNNKEYLDDAVDDYSVEASDEALTNRITRDTKENQGNVTTKKKEISIKLFINSDAENENEEIGSNKRCDNNKGKICVGKNLLFNLIKLGITNEHDDESDDGIIILDSSKKSLHDKKHSVYTDIMKAVNSALLRDNSEAESTESNENADIIYDDTAEINSDEGDAYNFEDLEDNIDDIGLKSNRAKNKIEITINEIFSTTSEPPTIEEPLSSEEDEYDDDDNNSIEYSDSRENDVTAEEAPASEDTINGRFKTNEVEVQQLKFNCSEKCKCECGNPNPVPRGCNIAEAESKVRKSKNKKRSKPTGSGITAPSSFSSNNNRGMSFFHAKSRGGKHKSCTKGNKKKCKSKSKFHNVSQRNTRSTVGLLESDAILNAVAIATTSNPLVVNDFIKPRKKKRPSNSRQNRNSKRTSSYSVRTKSRNGKK